MTGASTMSYSTVSMALRPPRVVVVFDGGDRWTYWARRAQYVAGQMWGGCGFALVPHRNGQVDPVLLRACRVYDPDYVVTVPLTVGDAEQFSPGWFQIKGEDGQLLTGEERERMLAMAEDQSVDLPAEEMAARDLIVEICSPYRTKRYTGSWQEDVIFLQTGSRPFHDALSVSGVFPGVAGLVLSASDLSVLACPPTWGGVLGVLTASCAGVVEAPDLAAAEPGLSEPVLNQLTSWVLGRSGATAPEELMWVSSEGTAVTLDPIPPAHIRSMAGLVRVSNAAPRRTGLVVLGDGPDDFALARLWQLTFGSGVWLPSVLGVDQDEPPWPLTYGLADVIRRHKRDASTLVVTSISRSTEQVTQLHNRLFLHASSLGGASDATGTVSVTPSSDLPWKQQSTTHLAVAEQFDTYVPVPTVVDETGTRSMAAPLPPPILNGTYLLPSADLTWQVDIGWQASQTVRGRALDGQEVFTPDTDPWLTWGRSSRNGISYQSHRYNFVMAGIPTVNKLACPAVRDLSLPAWIEAKGREHQLTTRISDAGQRAALLTRMLGGRRQFVELFSGPLLPALRDLRPSSSTSREAYPREDGASLSHEEGVLTFAGFCARTPDLEAGQVRERLDAVLRASVLRRGLVLQCRTCEEVQFRPIERIGQVWTCVRCDAPGDLNHTAWRKPDEPTWFYDLHPVGRHLLRDHGEVPALLSAYLAAEQANSKSTFHDVEELEFVWEGKPQVEVDLIAYIDDTLTVGECKSTDRLSEDRAKARAEVDKKCKAVRWLNADRLVFATTALSWTKRTPGLINSGVAAFTWGPLGPPEVHLITGLGATPGHQVLACGSP